jgi:predicted transcriptional regulator
MSKTLDRAIKAVRNLPEREQDQMGQMLLKFTELTPEMEEAIAAGRADIKAGRVATKAQMDALAQKVNALRPI